MVISSPAQHKTAHWGSHVFLACLVLLGGWLRWRAGSVDGLWLDEVFGANYTNLGFLETVVAVLRFDIHPPLYYLQLNAWANLTHSDAGLLLNSVVWSLVSVVLVYAGVLRVAGGVAASIAALMLTVAGGEVFYASELRMYAMLGANVLALWVVADRWVESPSDRALGALIVLLATLTLLHSAAFVAVGCVLAYLFVRLWQTGQQHRWRAWVLISFCAFALLLPWLVNASFRSVSHAVVPDISVMGDTISGWLLGYFPEVPAFARQVAWAFVVLLLLSVLGAGGQRARAVMFSFVVLPVVGIAAVSWLLRPIWLDRTLAFAAPFLVIAVVLGLANIARRVRTAHLVFALIAAAWCLLILGAGHLTERSQISRKMEFREAAAYIAQNNAEGMAVYVPVNFRFWGMARYLAGPQWGSLLKVQDPERVDTSDTWANIYRRLGPEWLARLGLQPKTRTINTGRFDMWIGLSPLPADVVLAGYFFVGDMNDAKRPSACPQGIEQSRKVFRGVLVARCLADLSAASSNKTVSK